MEKLNLKHYNVSEDLVRKELSLILEFEEIRNSQVLSKFIEFVVEKKLSGQEDEIKEYTIAVKGLGKPRDYNPQLDASVRIHAGRLRRLLTQYYRDKGKNDVVLIDIPKGTYIPVFTNKQNGNGHELTLPVIQEGDYVDGVIVNEFFELQKKPALAVLPFHNLSFDNSKDYFVAGIGEQLSSDMARFQNISVISYYTTSAYKAELKDLQELKEKVHIDYVLTGSVRFSNETMKINVQLILADNAEVIFTESYTRHLTPENMFEIEDEIIHQVSNVIADDNGIIMNKLHSSPASKPENLSVQDSINKYFEYTRDYSPEKFIVAVHALEKAVQTEPNNALALALLAGLYEDQYIMDAAEDKALLYKATELAHSAVELNPFVQQAQKVLAWAFLLSGKKEKSFEAIEKCIHLNPKASSIIATMALAYICQGDYIRGFKWLLESIHLNPVPPASTKICFTLFYYHNKEYLESLRWLERMTPLETPFLKLLVLSLYGQIYKKKNDGIDATLLTLKDNARNIIDRLVFDENLKKEIITGLQLAGLTVK